MISYNPELGEKLVSGLVTLDKAVSKTMGPLGRNVLIERIGQAPEPTKDGATVAKYVRSDDQIEQMAIDMGVQIARKTEQQAGDGTTGTINIATAMVTEGMKLIGAGVDVYKLQDEMSQAVEHIKTQIIAKSRPIETLEQKVQIATISANNDPEIGKVVGEMVHKIGLAPIDVDEGDEYGIKGEVTEGMEVDRGAVSKYFLQKDGKTELDNPKVLIFSHKLNTVDQIDPILARLVAEKINGVLVVADGYSDSVKDYLLGVSSIPVFMTPMGPQRGPLPLVAIEAWGWGDKRKEYLLDACALTGATLIEKKVEDAIPLLGEAEKIIITSDNTKFIGGRGNTQKRADELKAEIKVCKSEFDTEQLKIRLGKLTTGVGIIKVAYPTESATINKKKQLDDAIRATQSAVEKGAVAGGGTALMLLGNSPMTDGEKIVYSAICGPFKTILGNANANIEDIYQATEADHIYNAKTKEFGDPFEMGVIDPTKVILAELDNSLDLAKEILAVAVGIVHEKPSTPDNADHSDS